MLSILQDEEKEEDWVILEKYLDDDFEILIEGRSKGETPDDEFVSSTPDYYQVVYKTPWRRLIADATEEPTAAEIHNALSLANRPPELVFVNAKMRLLQRLFLKLESMSARKGYCIVCSRGKIGGHDTDCVLGKALSIIKK
jgi:hypothetical protein